jgi:hypothetical protein
MGEAGMMRSMLAGLIAFATAACMHEPMTHRDLEEMTARHQREAISRPEPDSCGMQAHRHLIGMDGDDIDRSSLPQGTRVICHDCMVTMDHVPQRLNVQLGPDGKVVSLRCG